MIFLTIAVFSMAVAQAAAGEVPDFIHICKRNNPDFNGCITESILHIQPYLVEGIPELNVPALEPLIIPEVVAVEGGAIKILARDIHTYGGSDFSFSNLEIDLDELLITSNVHQPNLYIDGTYTVDGKILLLPISGSGSVKGNFTDCDGFVRIKLVVRENEDGAEHLYCTEFDLTIRVGQGRMELGNLFGGEPILGEVVNNAINANFDIFIKEVKPTIEKGLAAAFMDIVNHIVKPFTFQQLLPAS